MMNMTSVRFLLFLVVGVGFLGTANAMDRTRECLLPDGRIVVVPKSSCQMYHETSRITSSNATYGQIAENLKLNQPQECTRDMTTEMYALCMMREQSHARDVVQLSEAMGSPLKAQDAREQRAYQERRDKREMVLAWATFGLNAYVAVEGMRSSGNGHGDITAGGDVYQITSKVGGGGTSGENGGSSTGTYINNPGDRTMVWNDRGNQQTLQNSSGGPLQDNRQEGTEFQPAAAEGSSSTLDNRSDSRDQSTFGVGL